MLLLIGGLGFQLPAATTLLVQGLGVALYASTSSRQCARECSLPYLRRLYDQAVRSVGSALALPITIARHKEAAAPTLTGTPACLLLHCWLLVVAGCALPWLLADWQEARAQDARHFGLGDRLTGGAEHAVVYVGLLVLASALSWKALELGLGPPAAGAGAPWGS